ncbi:LuxR C-terminal-related transcriptional regulator [Murimonas intestini]|uniref:LuxR family maltose regulon positive regulatory protein n=1 Tax=Murimonas intestini TaxID=1337051 RepID=A0AB73SZG7_9FIRM|nr:LuxR C-terminal-related transcriptional regulator [Murimonas intestini]
MERDYVKQSDFPVMPVKCRIPAPRKNYIPRRKLTRQLEAVGEYRVTVIKAGAGSGKTTLLSLFFKEKGAEDTKWIALDERMDQVFLFWRYILFVLRDCLQGEEGALSASFEENVQKDILWQMLAVFVNKIREDREIYLVLDDFQHIRNEFLIETIDYFIRSMPGNMHLILLSRETPGIYMGALSVQGQLLLLTEEDLRLTEEECRGFLIHTLGFQETDPSVEKIALTSNGWIGGAQLLAVASRLQKNKVYANTSERVIYEYIGQEIFFTLSGEEQEFLVKTSVLEYFSRSICEELLPHIAFDRVMGMILDKNLFVVNIGEDGREYSYHGILRGFLLHMLEKDREEKRELCRRAAPIYFRIGDQEEGVRLLQEAEDYETLMEKLLSMPQNVVTFSYMSHVPISEAVKNVNFAYQYFFCHYASLDFEKCDEIYRYIKENKMDDPVFQAFGNVNIFFNVNWDFKNITVLSLEQIEEMGMNEVTKAYLLIKEAYFFFLQENGKEAVRYLDRAESIYKTAGNIYIECFVLIEKTQVLEAYGELGQALRLYYRMKSYIESVPTIEASYHIGLAGLHIKQMNMDEAWEELELAKASVKKGADSVSTAYLYTLAEWYYIDGQSGKAGEILKVLEKDEMYRNIYFLARLLRYPIYIEHSGELTERFRQEYEHADAVQKNMDSELLMIGICYDTGKTGEALDMADSLIARARKSGNKLKIAEGSMLKARMLYEGGGDRRVLLNLFVEAVSYGTENGLALPFWYEKETAAAILEAFPQEIKKRLSPEAVDFVRKAAAQKTGRQGGGSRRMRYNLYELTARELEVIKEMEQGRSNKEIAESLCISMATVKTHIINIYSKLGVSNRVAAINKMRDW